MAIVPTTYGNVVIGGLPHAGGAGGVLTISNPGSTYTASPISINNGTGATWATTTAKGQLKVEGENADIFINGQSLSDWMSAVDRRLSILVPKPELQEKYTALQEAYNQYKTLEALLYDDQEPNK